MRGRVMSVYNLAFRLGIPVGSLALGKVISIIGVSLALAIAGLSLIAVTLYFVIVMREVSIFRPPVREAA